jgi:hypothetical protein
MPKAANDETRRTSELHWRYRECATWTDRGILVDLVRCHQIERPSLSLLQAIAQCLAHLLSGDGVVLGEAERRSKLLLVGWFNLHYYRIGPIIPRVVIAEPDGTTRTANRIRNRSSWTTSRGMTKGDARLSIPSWHRAE